MIALSGNDVRQQHVIGFLDAVAQLQLALLQPLDLEMVKGLPKLMFFLIGHVHPGWEAGILNPRDNWF